MVEPVPSGRFDAVVPVPGSKYVANRLLFIAALAGGRSVLKNLPDNEDIRTAMAGLAAFGIGIERLGLDAVAVTGCAGRFEKREVAVYTAGSGTFSRFLVPFAALSGNAVRITANEKMSSRPMDSVFAAVEGLGATALSTGGRLPATITGPLRGGTVEVDGGVSSQYFSALMLSALTQDGLEIKVKGALVSAPFVGLTASLMEEAGLRVEFAHDGAGQIRAIRIPGGQAYRARDWDIEPDPVSASYFMAAAALTGGRAVLPNWNSRSPQGEAQFPEVLRSMGCGVRMAGGGLEITGPDKPLRAVTVDLGGQPDVVQTLCACAAFAEGPTRITGIGHLKHKESDRIGETAREWGKLGIRVEAGEDSLVVHGSPGASGFQGAAVDGCGDHRMAMSLALLGLRLPGVRVHGEAAVGKSFPDFFDRLERAGVVLRRG
ncbi:MAG: 3-phosphoshikimate 1-carboxyvinyltransferase [Spirochaetes bacterium]|nr:3-phosphoshikimate 1-carboxyvinyltransferase [Spirochaetota bacterium]